MNSKSVIREANLFTSDLYQFTCSYSYFLSNRHQENATFEVFFRKYPFGGKYTILGGIRSVKDFFDNLQFTEEQEEYLKQIFPHMKSEYFSWIRQNLKKNIRIKSMKEGELVFAKEPLITYSGPISIVQLFETPILNLVGFASLVATNASRMVKAVEPKQCIEFGIRRAQGPDGALSASEYAFLGGFTKTSNLTAGKKLGIPCVGTMSHAYVTSFSSLEDATEFEHEGIKIKARCLEHKKSLGFETHDGELAAFIMYAKAFPNNFTTLIDSYSTLNSGLLNTIIVAKTLSEAGVTNFGLRLDSGDLGQQSLDCRKIWNKYFPDGPQLTIVASDDLHEERLIELQKKGNQIDVFAIGTNIATCKKQPALGLVCKLVELNEKPKMKFSEDEGKATYPAKKTVFRIWEDEKNQASFDLIALENEEVTKETLFFNPEKPREPIKSNFHQIQVLNEYWDICAPKTTLLECHKHFQDTKAHFPHTLALENPRAHPVYMTEKYMKVFKQTLEANDIRKQAPTEA